MCIRTWHHHQNSPFPQLVHLSLKLKRQLFLRSKRKENTLFRSESMFLLCFFPRTFDGYNATIFAYGQVNIINDIVLNNYCLDFVFNYWYLILAVGLWGTAFVMINSWCRNRRCIEGILMYGNWLLYCYGRLLYTFYIVSKKKSMTSEKLLFWISNNKQTGKYQLNRLAFAHFTI